MAVHPDWPDVPYVILYLGVHIQTKLAGGGGAYVLGQTFLVFDHKMMSFRF